MVKIDVRLKKEENKKDLKSNDFRSFFLAGEEGFEPP